MKTITDLKRMKTEGNKIVMMTAYDYPTAVFAENSNVDILLVGDSLGMVVLGYPSTVYVTSDDMVHHGKAVRRGAKDTFLVVDLPFGTFRGSQDRILNEAIRVFQETGADALKVEGADEVLDTIQLLTNTGIPVVAHLGLLPQSASVSGGYKVQGKTADAARKLLNDATLCEQAGACMIVVECIPHQLTSQLSQEVSIPIIGIGAGSEADGQVLVFHDLVKYGNHRLPKFAESFSDAGVVIQDGITSFTNAVRTGTFPATKHQFTMKEEELVSLYGGGNQ
ncbi:3-methyl-2-oxobutanoate hydroxymethyltransferase [Sporosarcina sp. BI001-red]|uniref:3-methyl-2-oxobutanoate hydroxymethyltransferase n=1 Tax=Sporosarcina sp. BI001-red TaxID=2282866 RepID=UPI000E25FAA1|nr:3-methyl-2-oxobutanoate hydroxymethyltransferase [Sporosarcina sp. BI001-red]REB09917.1 3-methyl-2-oxobutanoate hydroxymethyltransferase [Sporosarcina sp. BI001-red]